MRKKSVISMGILLLVTVLVAGSGYLYDTAEDMVEKQADSTSGGESSAASALASVMETSEASKPLRDKDTLYAEDDPDSVVDMYLTVSRGNASENTDHSWEDINDLSVYDYDAMGVDRYQVEGLLQVGDANGPVSGALGYGEVTPNATVQIRGQSSSESPQKNYKIRLKDNHGTWNGQQTIALNKHESDGLRFRNKLSFDLMKEIPQIMSLRTQFVHLYVKDETGDGEATFKDYGLYTQVEQLNKTALKAHGLDKNGQLYKVNEFEFYRYEDVIKLADDPDYDQAAFEKMLEIKGSNDHSKLIAMLNDLNDYSEPIEDVIEDHFNMENLTYWMAYQILTGNIDTQNRNMYLYSPQNEQTWYIYPWDMDGSFFATEKSLRGKESYASWERGISNYWGNILFRRCLKSEEFRKQLDLAIQDLRSNVLVKKHVQSLVNEYAAVVKPYVYAEPDLQYAQVTSDIYDEIVKKLPDEVEDNYQKYVESIQFPMPFFIGVPQVKDGKMTENWDVSYDIQQEDISYNAMISSNYDMKDPVATYSGVWPEMTFDQLPAGQYFIKVTATDASGHTQQAFDYYPTENGKAYGEKCFYVMKDGSIKEDTASE